MRRRLLAAALLLAALAPAAAAQPAFAPFLGTWQGRQGATVQAVYVFQLKDGALTGEARLAFKDRASGRPQTVEGEVSAIHVHGRTISFLVTNWGGGRDVDGSTAIYDLAVEGDRLSGRGHNYRTDARFEVRLERVRP